MVLDRSNCVGACHNGRGGSDNPGHADPDPPAVQEKVTLDMPPTAESIEAVSTASDVETRRHFDKLRNELRRELLDDGAETINWWLTAVAIVLTSLGVIAAFLSIIGFRRFREIEFEARENVAQSKKHAEEARELVQEIGERKKKADEATESMLRMADALRRYRLSLDLGDSARDDAPLSILLDRGRRESDTAQEAEEAVREVQRNPEASPLARAIADAVSLQRAGRIEEAIEKWRSIANVAEGSDNDLAARAWLSVGYLLYERGGEDAGEQ